MTKLKCHTESLRWSPYAGSTCPAPPRGAQQPPPPVSGRWQSVGRQWPAHRWQPPAQHYSGGSDKCRRRHGRMQLTIDPKMTAAMEVSDGAGRSCGSAQARRPTVTVEMMAGVRGVIWLQRRVHWPWLRWWGTWSLQWITRSTIISLEQQVRNVKLLSYWITVKKIKGISSSLFKLLFIPSTAVKLCQKVLKHYLSGGETLVAH